MGAADGRGAKHRREVVNGHPSRPKENGKNKFPRRIGVRTKSLRKTSKCQSAIREVVFPWILNDLANHISFQECEPFVASLMAEGQLMLIKPQLVEQGGVNVAEVMR